MASATSVDMEIGDQQMNSTGARPSNDIKVVVPVMVAKL